VPFSKADGVLLAVGNKVGNDSDLELGVQSSEGIAARVRVSLDTRYRQLADLLFALQLAGVSDIALEHPTAD
jgi:hypothetical protein